MKALRYILFLLVLIGLHAAAVSAVEMKDGRVKIVLHEESGRFSLYYLSDVTKGAYTPLLVAQDPRTTSLSVLFGSRVFRMGDGSQFTQSVFQSSGSIGYEWKSNQFTVREEFSFISSGTSILSDGVSIRITVTNVSESEKSVGLRYLFDTFLGENRKTHFRTDIQPRINNETTLPGNAISYIISQDLSADTNDGLQIMTKASGASSPEKVVLANWKRLNDSSWLYDSSPGREFSLLPYSVNDSAVLLYYPSETVGKGNSMEVTLLLGKASPAGFGAVKKSDTTLSSMFEKTLVTETSTGNTTAGTIKVELLNIDNYILQIDRKLNSGEIITDEEITVFRRVLSELQKRRNQFGE